MAIERNEVKSEDQWDLTPLYPSLAKWEEEFKKITKQGTEELQTFRGKLTESPEKLSKFLSLYLEFEKTIHKLYTYSHLKHDEDVADELNKGANDRIMLFLNQFQNEMAWVEPEILQLSEETQKKYLKAEILKEYHLFLSKIIRLKPHTLSADKEALLALANKPFETPSKAFGLFNNADLKFPNILDENGEEKELTHGTYHLYLQSPDRTLRKNAFYAIHKGFENFENTVCELVNGQVQVHQFNAEARNYASCLEAALFPHQIDPQVYHSLIKTIKDNIKPLHDYVSLRKKLLEVDELNIYDLYVPLIKEYDKKYTFDEALELVIDSVAILGKDYQETLRKGLIEERWVDRYENERKRSGAYSSGCYDSHPYILMNFHGTLRDVMTLAHEAGHSMHSLYSRKHQTYQDSHYSIFVAEVASTFHEELLFRHLMEKATTDEEKLYLINQKLDDVRATLFRQTQFAEFELRLHELAQQGVPLTPALLKKEYHQLNVDYYGPDLTIDSAIDVEFLRIPHFYYNFYVYQYATGISAADALVNHVVEKGESAKKAYLNFLSSGSSKYPLDLLEQAGVDMRQPKPIKDLILRFNELVNQLFCCSKIT